MNLYRFLRRKDGFSLIELSIVLVIVGLLTAGILTFYEMILKKKQVDDTKIHVADVNEALQKYQDENGFYPCPADPTSKDLKATNCNSPPPSGVKRVSIGGQFVRIGAVPVMDLSGERKLVSGEQTVDGYKHRLTYAVMENMAKDASQFVPDSGKIKILNETGGLVADKASFVVLSHGEDGGGAYTQLGNQVSGCSSSQQDGENCNNDGTFMVADVRSYKPGTDYNDDFASYATATSANTTKTCPKGTMLRGLKANGDLICTKDLSCPQGQAFTGILADGETPDCRAVSAACAKGQVLVSWVMGAPPVCLPNLPGKCPAGYVQNGTTTEGGTNYGAAECLKIMNQCPQNFVQIGTAEDGRPMCSPNYNTSCPGNQVQVGNNSDGTATCRTLTCPGGQYFYGISGGSPMCSGDRTVNDNYCYGNSVVVGISGGNVICGTPPNQAGTVAGGVTVYSSNYDRNNGGQASDRCTSWGSGTCTEVYRWGGNAMYAGCNSGRLVELATISQTDYNPSIYLCVN